MKTFPTMHQELSPGRVHWLVFVVSGVIYLLHKMEGRSPGSPINAAWYPDWHRRMPGLLVSHEPFDSNIHMFLTTCFHMSIAVLFLWLLYRGFKALDEGVATTRMKAPSSPGSTSSGCSWCCSRPPFGTTRAD